MAQSRIATILNDVPQAQWDDLLLHNNRSGNVVVGSNVGDGFGTVIFLGVHSSFPRPDGTTLSTGTNDEFVYLRQPENSAFNAGWNTFNLTGSTLPVPNVNPPYRSEHTVSGGGGLRLATRWDKSTSGGSGPTILTYRWDPTAQSFVTGVSHQTRDRTNVGLISTAGRILYLNPYLENRAIERVFTLLPRSSNDYNSYYYRTGSSGTFNSGVGFATSSSALGIPHDADILSNGDGSTVPLTRTQAAVSVSFDYIGSTLNARTSADRGADVVSQISTVTGSRGSNRKLVGGLADGNLVWVVYPANFTTANGLTVRNAAQPSGVGTLTFSDSNIGQPPLFPNTTMTADKILNIWLAESATNVGRRLALVVEFERDSANTFYRDYGGGSIEAPIFFITGDYTSSTNINWDTDAGWQPVIPASEQSAFSEYRGTDVNNPLNTIVHGVSKHGKGGNVDLALLRPSDRSIVFGRVADFRAAPNRPRFTETQQPSPAIITEKTANSYVANANFPLVLNWVYDSGTGGEQYGYTLRRRFTDTERFEYWNGSSWQAQSLIVVATSLNRGFRVELPGTSTSGWARNSDGSIIEEELEFNVQTYAEQDGPASPFSNSLFITPAESRDPIIVTPDGGFSTFTLFGSSVGTVNANEPLVLPDSIQLSKTLSREGLVGLTNLEDFDNGTLVRTLTRIRNMRIVIRGTSSNGGSIQLYNPTTTKPTSSGQGFSTNARIGGDGAFSLTFDAGNVADNSYFYVRYNPGGSGAANSIVRITSISITGETGFETLQANSAIVLGWAFTGNNLTAQSEYQVDLYEGRVTDFDGAVPLRSRRRTDQFTRSALLRVLEQGVYTARVFTIGQAAEGVSGLRSRDAYATFEVDLIDPVTPDSQTVELATARRNMNNELEASTTDLGREANFLLYRVNFPAARVPLVPGVGSSIGINGTLFANWRIPYAGGSPITEWEFQYNEANTISLLVEDILGDTSCVTTRWEGIPNGSYRVRARARNAAGWSPWSAVRTATATTFPTPREITVPIAPSAPRLEIRPGGRILVSMCDPVYEGERRTISRSYRWRRGGGSWTTSDFDPGSLDAFISGVVNNARYDVQVRSSNEIGDSPWSESYSVTPPATGVFRGVVPNQAIIYRRDEGETGEGKIVAVREIDTSEISPRFELWDWAVDEGVVHEYRSELFIKELVGQELISSSTDWIK